MLLSGWSQLLSYQWKQTSFGPITWDLFITQYALFWPAWFMYEFCFTALLSSLYHYIWGLCWNSYFSLWSKFGPVQDVRIPYQQKRMFGFVTFLYPETVRLILSKGNPHFICDSRVLVKPYKEKGKVPDKYVGTMSVWVIIYSLLFLH